MFHRIRAPRSGEVARILAALDSETRPYTDTQAAYPLARQARDARAEGTARRRERLDTRTDKETQRCYQEGGTASE